MKSLIYLFGLNKKDIATEAQTEEESKSEDLINIGRQQFKKLKELGLQIPIAVL